MPRLEDACSCVPPGNQVVQNNSPIRQPHEKGVQFSNVVVYSFAREQGFSAVPTSGWCSLGMASQHFHVTRYDVHHHQLLVKWRRRRLRTSSRNSFVFSIRKRKLRAAKYAHKGQAQNNLTNHRQYECFPLPPCDARVAVISSPPALSPQLKPVLDKPDNTETVKLMESLPTPPPPCLSPPSPRRVISHLGDTLCVQNFSFPSEILDTDSEASLDNIPVRGQLEASRPRHQKLLPVQGPARIRLLKEAGVTELDESERKICLEIRTSRARVGCDCAAGSLCVPDKCPCIRDGIQCQVDWTRFPCSCSAGSCRNPNGRTEFSRERVRANVLHVLNKVNEQLSSPLRCTPTKPADGMDNPDPVVQAIFPSTGADHLTGSASPGGSQYSSVLSPINEPNDREYDLTKNSDRTFSLTNGDSVSATPTKSNSIATDFGCATRGAATPISMVGTSTLSRANFPPSASRETVQILNVDPMLPQRDVRIKSENPERLPQRIPDRLAGQLDCPTSVCSTFDNKPLTVPTTTTGSAAPVLYSILSNLPTALPINNSQPSLDARKTRILTPSPTSFGNTSVSDCVAPRSISTDPRASLSRLSLRRRAIQRLIVTPSRRTPQQSKRSANEIQNLTLRTEPTSVISQFGNCYGKMDNSPVTTSPDTPLHPSIANRHTRTPLKASQENCFPNMQNPLPCAKPTNNPPSSLCRLPPE